MTYGCLFNNSLLLQLSRAGGAVRSTHPRLEGLLINQKDKIINQGWRQRDRLGPEPVAIHEGTTHPGLGNLGFLSHLCEHRHQQAGLSGKSWGLVQSCAEISTGSGSIKIGTLQFL